MLVIFFIQAVDVIVMLFINGLGAIVHFIYATPFTSLVGLIIAIIGLSKESNKGIPILTLIISAFFLSFLIFFYFRFTFGE